MLFRPPRLFSFRHGPSSGSRTNRPIQRLTELSYPLARSVWPPSTTLHRNVERVFRKSALADERGGTIAWNLSTSNSIVLDFIRIFVELRHQQRARRQWRVVRKVQLSIGPRCRVGLLCPGDMSEITGAVMRGIAILIAAVAIYSGMHDVVLAQTSTRSRLRASAAVGAHLP